MSGTVVVRLSPPDDYLDRYSTRLIRQLRLIESRQTRSMRPSHWQDLEQQRLQLIITIKAVTRLREVR